MTIPCTLHMIILLGYNLTILGHLSDTQWTLKLCNFKVTFFNYVVSKMLKKLKVKLSMSTPWRHTGEQRYPLILNLSTGWWWVFSFTFQPLCLANIIPPMLHTHSSICHRHYIISVVDSIVKQHTQKSSLIYKLDVSCFASLILTQTRGLICHPPRYFVWPSY